MTFINIDKTIKWIFNIDLFFAFYFQLNVLHVMSFMVERLGPIVEPYFDSLLQYLPKLWTESDDHHMLRCAIISTLTQIVRVCFYKFIRLINN